MIITSDDDTCLGDNPLITALLAYEYPHEETLGYLQEREREVERLIGENVLEFLLSQARR